MASNLIISGSYAAKVDTSNEIPVGSGVIYTESAVDKIVGSNNFSQNLEYDPTKVVKAVGVISALAGTTPIVGTDFVTGGGYETGVVVTGTIPTTMKMAYIKLDSVIGTTTKITVQIIGSTNADLAELETGQSVIVPFKDVSPSKLSVYADAYTDNTNEANATVILIGD